MFSCLEHSAEAYRASWRWSFLDFFGNLEQLIVFFPMRGLPGFRGAFLCFCVCLFFTADFCQAEKKTVEVIGSGECADCAQNNFKISQAFSGVFILHILHSFCTVWVAQFFCLVSTLVSRKLIISHLISAMHFNADH